MKLLLNITIALLLTLTTPVIGAAHADASVDSAASYVNGIAKQTMDILNGAGSKSSKTAKLEGVIKKHVDVEWIGKFVAGKHWKSASPEQKKTYLANYKDFILSSYASRFTEYKGSGYKMLKSRADSNNKYTVKMSIDVDGKPTMVDYKIKKKGSGYKIYDLKVEGVSLITTQRSEFNSVIQSKGLDYLIDQLGNKGSSALAAAK